MEEAACLVGITFQELEDATGVEGFRTVAGVGEVDLGAGELSCTEGDGGNIHVGHRVVGIDGGGGFEHAVVVVTANGIKVGNAVHLVEREQTRVFLQYFGGLFVAHGAHLVRHFIVGMTEIGIPCGPDEAVGLRPGLLDIFVLRVWLHVRAHDLEDGVFLRQVAADEEDRVRAESGRVSAENERVDAETTRKQAETDRAAAEDTRVEAEQSRADAETKRERDFTTAIKAAETATTGAETCNVELSGSTISVTNRHGETKSVDVINTDEEVTVTISSSVESIKVAGIKINVFLNNGKTPQSYTTNAEGKATFTVDRGNYYQVVFPEYGNAQPIAPQGYTAVLGSRNINVEYLPYDEDSMEKVIITATKYDDNVGTALEGIPVIVTVDRKDTTYQTDAKGQVTVFIPYKKEYTVRIDNQDGYNVSFNKNSRTNTANVPQRLIDYRFYQFKAGIFVVDIDKNEYYIEDWVAAGQTADDAVAIKVADASLLVNHGTFCIRTSDIKNVSQLVSKPWCTQNLQFDSIALNGNNVKDANYYNGESSSYLIRQEAQERSLSVPAFDYAYDQIFTIGGEELHGFVMSVGQEYVHVANIGIIKQVLETLYGEEVATNYYDFVMKKYRWTSTQSSATNAWYYSSIANNYNKWSSTVVLPVYAC